MDISAFGMAGVAAITVICYLVGWIVKVSGLDNKWIPVIVGVCGGILGVVGMLVMTDFPAADPLTAERSAKTEKMFEKIISEGKKSGKSIEEINAELKAAGANFHLNPDGGVAGWTDAEMEEGFIPAEEESKEARHTLDMRRRMEFAGTEQIQWIPGGRFAVSYDEDGYAKSAVRLHD